MGSNRKFSDTIMFLYNLGKYCGLSCYSLSKNQTKYEVSFETTDFLQLCSVIAVFLTLIYYNIVSEWKITNCAKNTVIFNSGQQILVRTALISALGGILQILLMRRVFWEIVNLLNEIDHQMMQLLKIQINHNSLYRHTLIYVTFSFVLLALVYCSLGYYFFIIDSGYNGLHYLLSFVLSNVAFVCITVQFQVLMYSVYMRFSKMNSLVESNMLQKEGHLLIPSKTLEFQKILFSIANITDQLNAVIPKMCYYFGPTMIFAFVGLFAISVFNFHNFYRTLGEKHTPEFYLLIFAYDILSLLFCIWAGLCISISAFNTSSAKRMGVLVHKVMARTHEKAFILRLKILSQQILHRSPDTSFGIFSLNWSLAYTIINVTFTARQYVAAVVSYIVILIQFENYIADDSKAH